MATFFITQFEEVDDGDGTTPMATVASQLRPSVIEASPLFLSILADRYKLSVSSLNKRLHPYHTTILRGMKLYRPDKVNTSAKRHPMCLMQPNPDAETRKGTPFWFCKYLGVYKHYQDDREVSKNVLYYLCQRGYTPL
jgi:hypothetical protein